MILAKPSLPERYLQPWRNAFEERIDSRLIPGVHILDIGAGRCPAIPPDQRPPDCHYAGIDVSASELGLAPIGSYDEMWVCDISEHMSELDGRFDLAVSWCVFEHVGSLDVALANIRAYLRPGGRLVAMFSGTFSAFGIVNTVLPQRVGTWAMHRLLGRDPETVYPAHYDRCWKSALKRTLDEWHEIEIVPRYRGAGYFGFSGGLQRVYLAYENWAMENGHHNLATHYVLCATR